MSYVYENLPVCDCDKLGRSSNEPLRACGNRVTCIYEFSTGDIKFSCGIAAHKLSIYNSLHLGDTMKILQRQSKNKFTTIHESVSCFQPLTQKNTLSLKMHNCKELYKSEFHIYKNRYPTLEYSEKKVRYTYLWNAAYITVNINGNEFDELTEMELYFKHAGISARALIDLQKKFVQAKHDFEQVAYEYKLPWTTDETTECSICISDITRTNGGHLTCGHSFHHKCIQKWILHNNHNNTCPNCRSAFEKKDFLVNTPW